MLPKQKMKIYNTLTRQEEELKSEEDKLVRVYSCGPTVYDFAHIGNLRKFVFDDLLVRTLKFLGNETKWVMNITDVGHLTGDRDMGEDKMLVGAEREHKSAFEIAKHYEKVFFEDLKKLNVEKPDVTPRATEHIQEQIDLVKKLEEKGFTYKTSDGIYFDTSKLSDYGKLAGLDVEGLKEGARVEVNDEKKNPTDFALWKLSVPKGDHPEPAEGSNSVIASEAKQSHRQMEWPSPWGTGFPGWHLECSAMSIKYLGQPFEIHTGGIDLIPTHHTNEIAQSEAAYNKPLSKYWMHSEFVLQDGHKMAKSAGHFIRLQDIIDRGFDPLDFRYLCLSAHYRSKLNFTWESLEGAREARQKLRDFALSQTPPRWGNTSSEVGRNGGEDFQFFTKSLENFSDYLSDDLNTPEAFASVFQTINEANKTLSHLRGVEDSSEVSVSEGRFIAAAKEFISIIDQVLALNLSIELETEGGIKFEKGTPREVIELAKSRQKARAEKDFTKADELRDKIEKSGYSVEDLQDVSLLKKS